MADVLTPRQGSLTVGTTAVDLMKEVPANVFRDTIYIKNTSTGGQVINIGDGQTAVAGVGADLDPKETMIDSADPAHRPSQNRISVVASAPGATISYIEKLVPVRG